MPQPTTPIFMTLVLDIGKASTSDRTASSLHERQKTTRCVARGGCGPLTRRRCSIAWTSRHTLQSRAFSSVRTRPWPVSAGPRTCVVSFWNQPRDMR